MLRGQMSPWQLESILNVHRNLPLKFHQNRVSNTWDIADIELLWSGWVGFAESFYCQTQICVEVRLGFWQYIQTQTPSSWNEEVLIVWGSSHKYHFFWGVCLCVCVYVCVCVFVFVCMCGCVCGCKYVCLHLCESVFMSFVS